MLFGVQSWDHPAGARTTVEAACRMGPWRGGLPVKFRATEETQSRKEAWPKAEQKGEIPGFPPQHTPSGLPLISPIS